MLGPFLPSVLADALRGVRVLDLGRLLPAPYATWVLAGLGASVDKLEDTDEGDYLRSFPPLVSNGADLSPDGPSVDGKQRAPVGAAFRKLNAGKRSLALNLKSDAGRECFFRLAAHYDVVVESFRPGTLDRLGIGPSALRTRAPRVILCSVSGFGSTGPLATRAGHDLTYLARAGILAVSGPAGAPPQVPGAQMADVSGGLAAALAVLAALHRRHTTGEGLHIEIALTDVARTLFAELGPVADARGAAVLTGGLALYNTYATADGEHLAVAALEPKFAERACAVLGLDFDGDWLRPGPHQATRKVRVAEKVGSLSRSEWEARLEGVDACIDPVCRPAVGDEGAGAELPPAPAQGEHGAAVLTDAGFEAEEIADLCARGVVRVRVC